MQRRRSDMILTISIWLAAAMTAGFLFVIVGFIFSNGWSLISSDFLTREANDVVRFVYFEGDDAASSTAVTIGEHHVLEIDGIGLSLEIDDYYGVRIYDVTNDSPARGAVDNADQPFPIHRGQVLEAVNGVAINSETDFSDLIAAFDGNTAFNLRVRELGGGVFPMIISTILLIGTTLLIATPVGVAASIYMALYAKQGRIVRTIRLAVEILAALPSVVHGLFGMLLFTRLLGLGTSILAGALTMTILLFPILIRSTEEALKTVPNSYLEASLGLGANKIQTIRKVILPSALPGIAVGIILSIGRIVGESAALLFTVGTFARLPQNPATGNFSIFETGATLTLRAFIEVQEFGNIEMASAIGIVILVIVFTLNLFSKFITKKFGT